MQLKDDLLFVVQSYRWAELENHNYIVGAFSTKSKAVKVEEECRGGKMLVIKEKT